MEKNEGIRIFLLIGILLLSMSLIIADDSQFVQVCYSDSTREFMILCNGDSAPIGKLPSPLIPTGGGGGGGGGCGSLNPEDRDQCCSTQLFNGTEGFDYFYDEEDNSCKSIPLVVEKKGFDWGVYLPFIIIGVLVFGFLFFLLWRRKEEEKKRKKKKEERLK